MRPIAVSLIALLAGISSAALATPFTVDSGTDNVAKTVTGTDAGSVAAGAALSTAGTAITWSGPSPAPGVTIDNSGTISGSRGIDTSGGNAERNLTFNNNAGATLSGSSNDAFRINTSIGSSTVIVNNAGTIRSTGGQAIDFDNNSSATANVQINNQATGLIEAGQADAVRPGQAAVVTNFGTICAGTVSGGTCGGGITGESNDAVDWQGRSGALINKSGGVISGQRHGTTSDAAVDVVNEAGAQLIGRNGSGVGSDGTGTVVNHGIITGAWDGMAADGDGDGVDIDFAATITNFGTIQGTGAAGFNDGSPNSSEGLAIGGGTVDNKLGALISGAHNGMLVDDSNAGGAGAATNLTNAGTIEGLNGFGVRLIGNQADTITNTGKIAGKTLALDMGGGNDLLKVGTGSLIEGLADGGEGFDTITVETSVTIGDVVNFEKLVIETGALLTLASEIRLEDLIGAIIDAEGDGIANIFGNGFNLFYDPHSAANAYLKGLSYALAGGGRLAAVPEPMTLALLAPGLIALFAGARRRTGAARA